MREITVNILSIKASNNIKGSAIVEFTCPELGIDETNPEEVSVLLPPPKDPGGLKDHSGDTELRTAIRNRLLTIVIERESFPAELEKLRQLEGKDLSIPLW